RIWGQAGQVNSIDGRLLSVALKIKALRTKVPTLVNSRPHWRALFADNGTSAVNREKRMFRSHRKPVS
ncbi:hypothetical protein, partial [Desulfosarcina sp.]|uniref:hypothetical protein n=1 Tax=Desulfosarcina sp. TaxID=2027861 RepID=UPI00397093F2